MALSALALARTIDRGGDMTWGGRRRVARRRIYTGLFWRSGFGMALLLALSVPPALAAQAGQIPAVVHVHSTWSTGDQSLDQLVDRAGPLGIQAIFLAENFLQRFEYGVPPLRGLLRHRVEYPSLMRNGVERFLEGVAAVNGRQGEVVVIPGAELIPHYYWDGSLWDGTLTLRDGQKNLLALGLADPAAYRSLPVAGNHHASPYGLQTLWLLSPALLAAPGLWLLTLRRRRTVQLQRFRLTEERRLLAPGLLCLAAAGLLLANNYPFRRPAVSPYAGSAGLAPHQTVIDVLARHGAMAGWSLPEARDRRVVPVGPFRATLRTDPHPDALLATDRFALFGGIYEDTTTFTAAGGGWDALLLAYLAGRRAAPAWAVGEAAYHREGQAGKRLGEVQTVLLAPRKTPAALLEAMRAGRMYARRRTAADALVLSRFRLECRGCDPVEAGGRLTAPRMEGAELVVEITTESGRPMPVRVRLVRSGAVAQEVHGLTPLTLRHREAAGGGRRFFRLEAQGPAPHRVLSNPVFLQPPTEATP
jgi:hypothetical protein